MNLVLANLAVLDTLLHVQPFVNNITGEVQSCKTVRKSCQRTVVHNFVCSLMKTAVQVGRLEPSDKACSESIKRLVQVQSITL